MPDRTPVANFLYRNPDLYEKVFHQYTRALTDACRIVFHRYLGRPATSILDVGCGTGVILANLAGETADCVGIDCDPIMLRLGQNKYPQIGLRLGDMTQLNLGRQFQAIIALGSVITYATSGEALDHTIRNLAAHCEMDGILFISLWNFGIFLGNSELLRQTQRIKIDDFVADLQTTYSFDLAAQTMRRCRKWMRDEKEFAEDFCMLQVIFPRELTLRLALSGFEVIGLFGDPDMAVRQLLSTGCYIVARRIPR